MKRSNLRSTGVSLFEVALCLAFMSLLVVSAYELRTFVYKRLAGEARAHLMLNISEQIGGFIKSKGINEFHLSGGYKRISKKLLKDLGMEWLEPEDSMLEVYAMSEPIPALSEKKISWLVILSKNEDKAGILPVILRFLGGDGALFSVKEKSFYGGKREWSISETDIEDLKTAKNMVLLKKDFIIKDDSYGIDDIEFLFFSSDIVQKGTWQVKNVNDYVRIYMFWHGFSKALIEYSLYDRFDIERRKGYEYVEPLSSHQYYYTLHPQWQGLISGYYRIDICITPSEGGKVYKKSFTLSLPVGL